MGMLPGPLIGLARIAALGQIEPLARMRGPRTSTAGECADAAPYAWERVARVRQSQDLPNQRQNGLRMSATGPLGSIAASRVDSRSAMALLQQALHARRRGPGRMTASQRP